MLLTHKGTGCTPRTALAIHICAITGPCVPHFDAPRPPRKPCVSPYFAHQPPFPGSTPLHLKLTLQNNLTHLPEVTLKPRSFDIIQAQFIQYCARMTLSIASSSPLFCLITTNHRLRNALGPFLTLFQSLLSRLRHILGECSRWLYLEGKDGEEKEGSLWFSSVSTRA